MSHVTTVAVKIRDLDALAAAAAELGAALVRGVTDQRSYQHGLKCDHVIRVPGCTYEVGVIRQPDGTFSLAYDFYGPGEKLKAAFGDKLNKLSQYYTVHAATAAARKQGYMVTRSTGAGGAIRLTMTGVA